MAVNTDVEIRNYIGLKPDFEEDVEKADWRLADAQPQFKYVDGKKTESQSATQYALMCVNSENNDLVFKTLTVKSEEIKSRDECDALVSSRTQVKVKVTKIVPWIKQGDRPRIEYSIWGDVEPVVEEVKGGKK